MSVNIDEILNMDHVPMDIIEELLHEIVELRLRVAQGCGHVRPEIDRFSELYIVDDNGCWLWQGTKNNGGYGKFSVGGVRVYAHRWSYEYFKGEIPDGLQVDHLCMVRHCVNPDHLEAVTPRTNYLRSGGPTAINASKTHCHRGHEFTDENTYLVNGKRNCRTCNRQRQKDYQDRKKK